MNVFQRRGEASSTMLVALVAVAVIYLEQEGIAEVGM